MYSDPQNSSILINRVISLLLWLSLYISIMLARLKMIKWIMKHFNKASNQIFFFNLNNQSYIKEIYFALHLNYLHSYNTISICESISNKS